MKVLLTGSGGQVGYELERSLQGLGDVIAVNRSRLDLANLDQVSDTIRILRPHLIINAAAYTAVDKAESEPELAMRVNGEAPAVMAEEARKIGAAMIHYSTDYVFDGSKPAPYVEDDAPCPINVYGRTKLASEQAIQASGVPHLILRTSWVYGTRGRNFLLTVQRLAREREELRIVADQYGAPTWCRTIADATSLSVAKLQAACHGAGLDKDRWQEYSGIYHLTSEGKTTWHGFAEAIVARTNLNAASTIIPISAGEYPLPAKRPANSSLSTEKMRNAFCRLPDWETALDLCLG